MQERDQLRAQLQKTLSTYARGLSVDVVLSELRRLGDELTQIALQKTDSGKAIDAYVIDIHGVVRERKKPTWERPSGSGMP